MPGILFGYLAAAGVRASRVGIVHADDAFGREVLGAVESHLGAAASGRLARFSFPVGILDAEAMLQALGKPLPDLLVVVGRPEENSLAIRRARREAGSSLLVCAVGGLPEGELTKDKKRELDGTLVLDFWSGNWRTAGEVFGTSESFARTFKKVNGFDPDYHVASAALALLVVKRGIEKAGGTTARGVAAAIAALDEETVFGRAAFAGNGRIRGGAYLGEVRHGKIEPLWPVGRGEGGSPIGR
jgi:ABC-type branched-subunit amino acid transport system substrate-binding protein